jgi:hypothetical protein
MKKILMLSGLGLVWLGLMFYLFTRPGLAPMLRTLGLYSKNQDGSMPGPLTGIGAKPMLAKPPDSFTKNGDYFMVDFDALGAFNAETPDAMEDINLQRDDLNRDPYEHKAAAKKQEMVVPPSIQGLDNRKVQIAGFMIPVESEKDSVYSFILVQSRMNCCFGVVPKLNQWIFVTMEKGKSTGWSVDIPITVYGTLGVGKKYDKENKGWCFYRLVAEKVALPKKSWF